VHRLVLLLAGCGRIAFDPTVDRTGDGSNGGAVQDAISPPDLILHLKFDSPDFLHEPHGHRPGCTACPTQVAAKIGTGALFDGTTFLTVVDADPLHPPQVTIAMWAYTNAVGETSMFSRAFNGATDGANSWELITMPDGTWQIGVNSVYAGKTLANGAWHHIALVADDQTLIRYFDGQPNPAAPVGTIDYGADDLTIGCDIDYGSPTFEFSGIVDDIRIYNRLLSGGEIAALAQL
jgi:hypothetical protein